MIVDILPETLQNELKILPDLTVLLSGFSNRLLTEKNRIRKSVPSGENIKISQPEARIFQNANSRKYRKHSSHKISAICQIRVNQRFRQFQWLHLWRTQNETDNRPDHQLQSSHKD